MKKNDFLVVIFVLAIAISVVSASSIVASESVTAEKEVEKVIKEFANSVKKYDTKQIPGFFINTKSISLLSSKKKTAKFIRDLNKQYFSCEIVSIKISSSTAKVKLRISKIKGKPFLTNGFKDTLVYVKSHKVTTAKLDNYMASIFRKYYKELLELNSKEEFEKNYIEHRNITIELKKVGKKWKILKFSKLLSNAIQADCYTALQLARK